MSRDFPDELLSAYLDGELSPDERAGVERHLASCEADRQLLDELRALRRDMAELPRATAKPGFAERVVKAALASPVQPAGVLSAVVPPRKRSRIALAAVIVATAACALLFARLWWLPATNTERTPLAQIEQPVLTLAEQLIAALRASAPGEGEAAVLRLRLPRQISASAALDAALRSAGIQQLSATDVTKVATDLGAEYRKQIAIQNAAKSEGGGDSEGGAAGVPAADALFIEAPLAQLEAAFALLATDPTHPVELAPELKLAFIAPPTGRPEGEGGSASGKEVRPPVGQPFAQRLPPEAFLLLRRDTCAPPAGAERTAAGDRGKAVVRLLILVEQIDAPH